MSDAEHILPQYKLLVTYNIKAGDRDKYYQFVMGEMIPALQEMGLYMAEAWHTAYGPYPIRLLGYVAEDVETINEALTSTKFVDLEDKLRKYVSNYTRQVVSFRDGFQFM